jgi:hypothetical protein
MATDALRGAGRADVNYAAAASRLRALRDPVAVEAAIELMQLAKDIGLKPVPRKSAISFRFPVPGTERDKWLTVFLVSDAGTFYIGWTDQWARAGARLEANADYRSALAEVLGPMNHRHIEPKKAVPLRSVAANREDVSRAIREAVSTLKADVASSAHVQTVWKLVAHHADAEAALTWSKETGRLAVGWGSTGDLRAHEPDGAEEIGALIRGAYPEATNAHIGGPSLWNLYDGMAVGDLVIVTADGRRDHVAEVTGDYVRLPAPTPRRDLGHRRRSTVGAVRRCRERASRSMGRVSLREECRGAESPGRGRDNVRRVES